MKFYFFLVLVTSAGLISAQKDIDFSIENFTGYKQELQDAKRAIKRGDIHLENLEYENALPEFQKAHGFNSENSHLNFKMGLCRYYSDLDSLALLAFEKAVSLNSKVDEDIHFYIARCNHLTFNFEKAITHYSIEMDFALNFERPEYVSALQKFIIECRSGIKLLQEQNSLTLIVNLGQPVNSTFPEYSPSVTKDDSKLYFTSGKNEDKGRGNSERIYYAIKSDSSWSQAVNIGEPPDAQYIDAVLGISKDAKTLYLYAYENKGDIFFSKLSEAGFSETEPFSYAINSRFAESSLCFTNNEDTLFFTSDRPGSFGGKDIYYSVKEKDEWQTPVNIGNEVNTEYDEESVFLYNDTLFFASRGHNSMGGFDIFKTFQRPDGSWNKPENLGFPVNSPYDDLYFTASDSNTYFTSERPGGRGKSDIYSIVILPPVYVYTRPDSIIRNPVRFYTISPIQFELKSFQNEDACPTLDILADFLHSEPGIKVLITGYTDTQGDHEYNMKLSQKRAGFVRDYLVSQGVSDSCFQVDSKGPGKQVSRNTDDKGRYIWKSLKYNRRVEIIILKQGIANHLIIKPTDIPLEYQIPGYEKESQVYSIWLMTYKEPVEIDLFGLKNVQEYKNPDGLFDYFWGRFDSLPEAEKSFPEVKMQYPNSHIVILPYNSSELKMKQQR